MLTLANMLGTKNEYFSKQIFRKTPKCFMRETEGNPFHLIGISDKKKLFKSLLKNKKRNLVKKTSKILDHRNFSNITMPSNIYLFKVSIGSTGTDVKYLLS